MKTNTIVIATLLTAVTLGSGCGNVDPAEWRFGENITGLRFEIFDEDEGIHPSKVVLLNPRNPFVDAPIGPVTKFQILAEGGNAASFYCWATLLAGQENGENQFYAATSLRGIYDAKEVDERLLPAVKDMAIRAFESVLKNFPDAVTFNAQGAFFRLATPAYKAIIDLGGERPQGWVLVTTPSGGEEAVQGGDDKFVPPDPAFLPKEDQE